MDIEDVWRAYRERSQAQKEEITRDVPTRWTEGLADNPKNIGPDKYYNSHAGGGVYGPTCTAFANTADECVADVFLLFFPIWILRLGAHTKCKRQSR
jgi:hypothetical protein